MDNQNWTFGGGLTFNVNDNHTIKADYDISKQKYDNSEGQVGTIDSYETLFKNQRVGYEKIQRMEREQYSLNWEGNWDLGKSIIGIHQIESANFGRSLPLNAEQRKLILDNKRTSSNPTGIWTDLNTAMADPRFTALLPRPVRTLESTNTTYSAKYELPFEEHFLVIGTEYLQAQLKDDAFTLTKGNNNKKEYDMWSVFAEDNWNIIDPLTFTTGVRYDKHEDFGSHVSPRAYLTYSLNDNWTLKGGVATGYKTPKTTDLQEGITGFTGQGTGLQVGNPDLKPEESLSKEVAVYYEHPNKHNFNITLFQNNFKDKIESVEGNTRISAGAEWEAISSSNASLRQKQNVGKAEILGLEFTGKYFILDNLSIKANWTYMDSEIESNDPSTNGRPLRSSPKHMYNSTLDWQTTSKFNTYLQYSGEIDRFKQRYKTNNENYKDLYYKDYSIWNLGASYKVDKNLTFNGRVNNLFDKDLMEYDAVDRVGTTNYYEDYSNIGAGRNFWLSANYTF